jgi:hypothetical protein
MNKSKIHEIFFLRKDGGILLLHVPYIEKYEDPAMTAAFISAIDTFAKMGNGQLKKVGHTYTDLLLFKGKHSVLAAIVGRGMDLSIFRKQASDLLERFENEYEYAIINHNGLLNGYYKFIYETLVVFPYYELSDSLVLRKTERALEEFSMSGHVGGYMKILQEAVNSIRTTGNIYNITGRLMPKKDILTTLGIGIHEGFFKPVIDIFAERAPKFVIQDVYGKLYPEYLTDELLSGLVKAFGKAQMNLLLPQCDGVKSLREIADDIHVDVEVLSLVMRKLISTGTIVLVPIIKKSNNEELEWILQ